MLYAHCIIIIDPLSMFLVLRELIHLQTLVFPCKVRLYSMLEMAPLE